MTTSLYTVYDRIAMRCGPIFHAINDGDAIRGFKKRYKDQEDRNDFRLLKLGVFDHAKCVAECLDIPDEISVNFAHTDASKEE